MVLYKSLIDFATFIDISVILLTKNLVAELSLILFFVCEIVRSDIFIIWVQHVLGFVGIDATFILFHPSVKTF